MFGLLGYLRENAMSIIGILISGLIASLAVKIARSQLDEQQLERKVKILQMLHKNSKECRNYFQRACLEFYKKETPDIGNHLLYREGWMLDTPIPLSQVQLRLHDEPWKRKEDSKEFYKKCAYLPKHKWGYAECLRVYCGATMVNLPLYGLLGIQKKESQIELQLKAGSYFDFYDTCEILAIEMAKDLDLFLMNSGKKSLRLRNHIEKNGGIFQFDNRFVGIGIVMFTVFRNVQVAGGITDYFMVHHRGKNLAEGTNQIHAIPAGSFQPSGMQIVMDKKHQSSQGSINCKDSMVESISREFAEEVLGFDEFAVDNRKMELFQKLGAHYEPLFMGLGLDPVNTKAEVLALLELDFNIPEVAACFGGRKLSEVKTFIEQSGDLRAGNALEGNIEFVQLTTENLLKYEMHPDSVGAFRQIIKQYGAYQNEKNNN